MLQSAYLQPMPETNPLSFRSVLFVKSFRLWGVDLIWQMAGIDMHLKFTR